MGAASGTVNIQEIMKTSGAGFGTSGVRGRVVDLTDRVCYAYTRGFLGYLKENAELGGRREIAFGGDLRPSTGRIMSAVAAAIRDCGQTPVNCGRIASPALAYYGITRRIPTVMVTGSHIPEDRNGIKFTMATGEISKEDETGIVSQAVEIPEGLFDGKGMFGIVPDLPEPNDDAWNVYIERYLAFFPNGFLKGKRIGVYQHSTVLREVMVDLYRELGAEVTPLGFSETFLPVDTEAIREEDVRYAREWAQGGGFDAIVSADGDGDRPLISDEAGNWLRGDVAGILCARYLKADTVVTPVSSNTAVEKSGWFDRVIRTRIGSPYVVAAMERARYEGSGLVVGYEANGGFLTASDIERGTTLRALPTRDALLLQLSILGLSIDGGVPISRLVSSLPGRYTHSDRLKNFPISKSRAILNQFTAGTDEQDRREIEAAFGAFVGSVKSIDTTDGVRITFDNEEIVHLRPSGNAPEFRCYTEAASPERAEELNRRAMNVIRAWA